MIIEMKIQMTFYRKVRKMVSRKENFICNPAYNKNTINLIKIIQEYYRVL